MKIGSTTGFIRSMVDVLLEDAKKQGFEPDVTVAGNFNRVREFSAAWWITAPHSH